MYAELCVLIGGKYLGPVNSCHASTGPGFDPRNSRKKPGLMVLSCILSAGEAEQTITGA